MYCNTTVEGAIAIICAIGIFIITIAAVISTWDPKPEEKNNDPLPETENSDPLPRTGTLEIIQTFEGLNDGIVPEEFILKLFPPESIYDLHYNHSNAKTICSVMHDWVNGFCLTGNDDGDALFEHIRDNEHILDENGNICGFKVTLTDLPPGTYYVEASVHEDFKAWVPGYHRKGTKVNDAELQLRPGLIPVVIGTNGIAALSLAEVYEPNRTFTENERAALAEAWRAHNALKAAYFQRTETLKQYLRK